MARLYLALALVVLLLCGALYWSHAAADDAALAQVAQHAENGYRVALAKLAARRAMVAKTAERHQRTIAASDEAVTGFHRLSSALTSEPSEPVHLTPAITLVGQPLPPLDTVVTLGFTRAIIASADTAIGKLLAERAAANARIVALNDFAVAQDSALAKADTTITRYKALAEARGCRVFGIPCPSRKVSAGLGAIVAVLTLGRMR